MHSLLYGCCAALPKKFSSPTVTVQFAHGNETDPVKMMQQLIEEYEERGLELEDFAACLVDSDFDTKKDFQLKEAEQLAAKEGNNVQLIVSSPCFEIWFLCHFSDSTRRYNSNEEVVRALKERVPEYRKSSENMFEVLLPYQSDAIENAMKLEKCCDLAGHRRHTVDYYPSTEIYKVVEFILACNNDEK